MNGQWGKWKNITICTARCGGGELKQTRNCDSPKLALGVGGSYGDDGGSDCAGDGERTIGCNTHQCQGKLIFHSLVVVWF